MIQQTVGLPLRVEVLARAFWTAGHSLVAEKFGKGRIFIGGDAAHLFTPMGGLGYNTAIEDAVNLGWKLAAVIGGTASEKLLASYEAERRPLALRNTAYAKGFADSLGNYVPPPEIEDDTPAGEAARRQRGRVLRRAWPRRVQHSRHYLRRPLRWLAGDRARRHRAAAGYRQRLRIDCLPRRPPASFVDARRPLAL